MRLTFMQHAPSQSVGIVASERKAHDSVNDSVAATTPSSRAQPAEPTDSGCLRRTTTQSTASAARQEQWTETWRGARRARTATTSRRAPAYEYPCESSLSSADLASIAPSVHTSSTLLILFVIVREASSPKPSDRNSVVTYATSPQKWAAFEASGCARKRSSICV